ncbi:30S ribosomal protein S20 [Hutsoniella sourekii]
MANSKQAIKRVRQAHNVTDRNNAQTSKMRTAIKNALKAIESGEGDVQALVNEAYKQIDRSANRGLIHANKASREKSRIAQLLEA